jgi:hypothetical protein
VGHLSFSASAAVGDFLGGYRDFLPPLCDFWRRVFSQAQTAVKLIGPVLKLHFLFFFNYAFSLPFSASLR